MAVGGGRGLPGGEGRPGRHISHCQVKWRGVGGSGQGAHLNGAAHLAKLLLVLDAHPHPVLGEGLQAHQVNGGVVGRNIFVPAHIPNVTNYLEKRGLINDRLDSDYR